jgi:hypothetical protein
MTTQPAPGTDDSPPEYPYVWAWRSRPTPSRQDQRCRVICRGTMNSALVEFEDGTRHVTSRNGLRKAPCRKEGTAT